ncbi:hypothetical protein FACS189473_5190 [Spirochaetia bacterium]|nr:hypothetical protein FACS189473_5190 [Spirochaetia bacterium]
MRIIPQSDDQVPDKVSENQRIATALDAIGYEIDEFKKEGVITPFTGNHKDYNGVISIRITPRV